MDVVTEVAKAILVAIFAGVVVEAVVVQYPSMRSTPTYSTEKVVKSEFNKPSQQACSTHWPKALLILAMKKKRSISTEKFH